MSRIAYCLACSNTKHGVRTRIPQDHTCGKSNAELMDDFKKANERISNILHQIANKAVKSRENDTLQK